MIRVYVLCEGHTEENFVNELLTPWFEGKGIMLSPFIHSPRRDADGTKYKGGGATYGKIRNALNRLCHEHANEYVTMMFDYYQIPRDTPGNDISCASALDKALHLEEQISRDIGNRNFIPNIILHEFEGLLFSAPEAFAYCDLPSGGISELQGIRDSHESPEHIDDGITTAPSKRILALHPAYRKVIDGVIIARDIGIDKIMSECRHFSGWIDKILNLKGES